MLHYAAGQLFWQCRSLTACSSLPEGFPHILDEAPRAEREWMQLLSCPDEVNDDLSTLDKSKCYSAWRSIVQAFSSCELTRSSDKLPAIEGVAQAMSHVTGDEYCTGLWTNDLVEQLAWKARAHLGSRGPPRHLVPYRAPSWAWPSLDRIIELPKRRSKTRNYSAEVLQLLQFSSPASQGGLCTVQTALRLRGHIFQLIFVYHNSHEKWTWLHKSLTDIHNMESAFLYADDDLFGHMEDLDWRSEDEEHNNKIRYKTPYVATVLMCAYSCEWARRHEGPSETGELYSGHGLAIERNKAGGTWTRIGLLEFENLSQELWDHLQDRRMTPHGNRPLETEDFDHLEGHTITLI